MQVPVKAAARFDFGEATLTVPGRYLLDKQGRRNYDVAPDGRFLMIKDAGARHLVVVQNWIEELERLVPVD